MTTDTSGPAPAEGLDQAFLDSVMAEIDEEVRRRRASGDLPARVERELDELFLQFSPVASRDGGLHESLRMVDAAAYIDPVVPIESQRSGGAVVKKGLRQASLWYVGYITHQVSQFATAVSRSLHLLDDQVTALSRQLDEQRVPSAPVLDVAWAHGPDAWWVDEACGVLKGAPGRILHAACGDGWLVRRLGAEGLDAFGVDPRPGLLERAEVDGTDLRQERPADQLRATASAALGGLVLTGVVDGMAEGERQALLDLVADRLAPGAVLVVHSLSPAAWAEDDLPADADLAPGHPLRAATWAHVLEARGFTVAVHQGPERRDYLVGAVLGTGSTTPR